MHTKAARPRVALSALASLVLVAALASCGPQEAATVKPDTTETTYRIQLSAGYFIPEKATILAGTLVIWETDEHYQHHYVRSETGLFRGWLYGWNAYRYTFTTPGTYNYYDELGPPTARGTVIVLPGKK